MKRKQPPPKPTDNRPWMINSFPVWMRNRVVGEARIQGIKTEALVEDIIRAWFGTQGKIISEGQHQ